MQLRSTHHLFIHLFLVAAVLCACAPSSDLGATPEPTQPLVEYTGSTPTPTLAPQGTQTDLLPTATPFIYTVVANDTFFGIAASLGISLDALIAANPGIDARSLSPGTQLVIPNGQQAVLTTALPTITPVQTNSQAPSCYTNVNGELWCFVMVINDGNLALENVTGVVSLLAANGSVLASLEAVPPLNVVPVGAQMPLVAYSDDAPANWATAQTQILTAFNLPNGDEHYLDVQSIDYSTNIADSGVAARMQGSLTVSGNPQSIWVLAVAYDSAGNVVGVRRWESETELNFDMWVYSLGPAIAQVELIAEARP